MKLLKLGWHFIFMEADPTRGVRERKIRSGNPGHRISRIFLRSGPRIREFAFTLKSAIF